MIISQLIEIVREHTELINDEDVLLELLTIIRNERGRIEAPVGGHDDQMMGLAIAHEIRSQVSFADEVIYSYPEFKEFEIEQNQSDYGEEIVVV